MVKGKNRLIVIPLVIICTVLMSFSFILAMPEKCNSNGGTLNVTITTPLNDAQIPYCSNFTVSANITSPDTINDLNAQIVISGNASIVNGDTDGTPDTYYLGTI